jgi:hypothetical protein
LLFDSPLFLPSAPCEKWELITLTRTIYACLLDAAAVILYFTVRCLDASAALVMMNVYATVKSGAVTLAILQSYVRRRTVNAASSVFTFVVAILRTQPPASNKQITAAVLLVSVLSHLSLMCLASSQTMV